MGLGQDSIFVPVPCNTFVANTKKYACMLQRTILVPISYCSVSSLTSKKYVFIKHCVLKSYQFPSSILKIQNLF